MEIIGGKINALECIDCPFELYDRYKLGKINIYLKNENHLTARYGFYHDEKTGNSLLYIGEIFDKKLKSSVNIAKEIFDKYCESGVKGVSAWDVVLTFFFFSNEKGLEIISDKHGVNKIYYNNDEHFIFSNRIDLLLQNYSEADIDYSSIYDFLNYGTLLGNRTFSKSVKLLNGGYRLRHFNGENKLTKYYQFHYKSGDINYEKDKLMEELAVAYSNALKKRMEYSQEKGKDICIFASGGLDSRFLISFCNNVSKTPIDCFTFSQKSSSEAKIAKEVCDLGNNNYKEFTLTPYDFIKNSMSYIRKTGGMDMCPQSYIIDIAKDIAKDKALFLTGFSLDALIGGTFINDLAIESNQIFSEFISGNRSVIKMELFTENEFKKMCIDGVYKSIFDDDSSNLTIEAKKYDDYRVEEIIQPFGIDSRAKRTVMLRDMVPSEFLGVSYPSLDDEVLKVISKIPSKYRHNHIFYREFLMKFVPEYCQIRYNNTNLPVTFPINSWKEGSNLEYKREKMYEKYMKEIYEEHGEVKYYYDHYYSDFNGYSRYDKDWKNLFKKYLLSKDSYISNKFFKREVIQKYYDDHKKLESNNRKKLLFLLSLELFFRVFLNE